MEDLRKIMYRLNDRSRQKNTYLFFSILFFIIIISGTLGIDQNVADKGVGYFTHQNIKQTNEAVKLGYVKYEINDYADVFGVKWKWKPGVKRIIRSGPDDYDDIGYILIQQTMGFVGIPITIHSVEILHNLAFIVSLVILSFVVVRLCKILYAGWLFMIMALIFKSQILSFVYGSPDSRTITIIFPVLFFSIIFLLCRKETIIGSIKGQLLVLFCGLVVSMFYLIRSSEGMMAILTILVCVMLLKIKFKYKLMSAGTILSSLLIIFILLPGIFALHRDIKTGEYNGEILPYLRGSGKHQAYHSIVLGLGKYPNSIGMRYNDTTCYNILRSRYPNSMHPKLNYHGKGYYNSLRSIYLDYITHYPKEYITNLSKSFFELFYFIPYSTSVGNLAWSYGYLPKKDEVNAKGRDLAPIGVKHILNIRTDYLRMNFLEWGIYLFSLLVLIYFISFYLPRKVKKSHRILFLTFCFYLFLQSITRAIVPQHGLTLVVGYWIFFFTALLYISFNKTVVITQKKSLINWAKENLPNNS